MIIDDFPHVGRPTIASFNGSDFPHITLRLNPFASLDPDWDSGLMDRKRRHRPTFIKSSAPAQNRVTREKFYQ